METRPGQPAEGRLIEEARERLAISQNKAAKLAGMSGTRWRQLVYGEISTGGAKMPVRANAETLARMANVVKVSAEQLADVGRDDAAEGLAALLRDETGDASAPQELDEHLRRLHELWPQLSDGQRGAMVRMLEDVLKLGESVERDGKPEHADERRTG